MTLISVPDVTIPMPAPVVVGYKIGTRQRIMRQCDGTLGLDQEYALETPPNTYMED